MYIQQSHTWHYTSSFINSSHTCPTSTIRRAAAAKWRSGKLLLSATLAGHRGPVTCIAALQHIIATGSSDCSARVWDLQESRQLQLLQHAEPLVAVALPSVSLCVTATAQSAHLWRQGKAIRRFDVTPVSCAVPACCSYKLPTAAAPLVAQQSSSAALSKRHVCSNPLADSVPSMTFSYCLACCLLKCRSQLLGEGGSIASVLLRMPHATLHHPFLT